jgi:hypothetical protein
MIDSIFRIGFLILFSTVICYVPTFSQTKAQVFQEKNGVVSVEAENFFEQSNSDIRKWYVTTENHTPDVQPDHDPNHSATASGKAYIEILPDTRVTHDCPLIPGENYTEDAGTIAVVSYLVNFKNPGKYYVWVRAYSTGTEDNGVHVGINDTWPSSGRRMQWHDGKNEWTWESKQRTQEVHSGIERLIFLEVPSKGIHKISFSMREDGFEMDKWVMSKEYVKPVGKGPKESKSIRKKL